MPMKSLFEIAVPVRDNNDKPIPKGKNLAFETFLLSSVGGYTRMPATEGAWSDGKRVYYDEMRAYRIACDPDTMRQIVKLAFAVYSDQAAIFVAEIGRAWIIPRNMGDGQLYRFTREAGNAMRIGGK